MNMDSDTQSDETEWMPDTLLFKLGIKSKFPSSTPLNRKIDVTLHSLEESLLKAAVLVEKYGDTYIEIYERIESEIARDENRLSKVSEAKDLAREHGLDRERNLLEP